MPTDVTVPYEDRPGWCRVCSEQFIGPDNRKYCDAKSATREHLAMRWVTREKIKVDRVACPWLIRKFIDRDAEFVFLPDSTNWEAIQDGIVFDVPNCELGHHVRLHPEEISPI